MTNKADNDVCHTIIIKLIPVLPGATSEANERFCNNKYVDIKCSSASQKRTEIILLLNEVLHPHAMTLALIYPAYSLYLIF